MSIENHTVIKFLKQALCVSSTCPISLCKTIWLLDERKCTNINTELSITRAIVLTLGMRRGSPIYFSLVFPAGQVVLISDDGRQVGYAMRFLFGNMYTVAVKESTQDEDQAIRQVTRVYSIIR